MFRTAAFRLPAIASLMIGLSIMFALTANLLFGQVRRRPPPAQGTPPAGQEGAPMRVYFTGDAQLATLAAGCDIWEVDRAAGYAVVYADSGARAQLLAAGLRAEEDPIRAAEFLASLPVFPGEASAAAVESIPAMPATAPLRRPTARSPVLQHSTLTWRSGSTSATVGRRNRAAPRAMTSTPWC